MSFVRLLRIFSFNWIIGHCLACSMEHDISGAEPRNASPAAGNGEAACLDVSGSSSTGTPSNPDCASESSPSPQRPERVTYTVGDHCYFDTSASGPYQIRRLDEFVKNGHSVDVKVFIYSRKSDLPFAAQKHISGFIDGEPNDSDAPLSELIAQRNAPSQPEHLHLAEHITASREVFLNKDEGGPIMETLPTTLIRGKCSVVSGKSSNEMDDVFFSQRAWYLPTNYHVGEVTMDQDKLIKHDSQNTYQAVIPSLLPTHDRDLYSSSPDKADLIWRPNQLPDCVIMSFVKAAVAVGLMARCVSITSADTLTIREEPDTIMRVAGMDSTLMAAYDLLHDNGYDLGLAINCLVGRGMLWSKRSVLETFDENDMNYFYIGLQETSRDIRQIHEDWLPWRSFTDIVNFYYLFKPTSFYKAYKSTKAGSNRQKGIVTSISMEAYDSKTCRLRTVPDEQVCYGCYELSDVWFAWTGLYRCRRQLRAVCRACWDFWKRYGCLKRPWKGTGINAARKLSTGFGSLSQTPVRLTSTDPNHYLSPKPALSSGKHFLLSHRSPPPTLEAFPATGDAWAIEKTQAEEEEFEYNAGDEWRLARRLAGQRIYDPRQLARFPILACGDEETANDYFRSCPGFLVDCYRGKRGRKRQKVGELISKISQLNHPDDRTAVEQWEN